MITHRKTSIRNWLWRRLGAVLALTGSACPAIGRCACTAALMDAR